MTRRDYELLTFALRDVANAIGQDKCHRRTHWWCTVKIADAIAAENPAFDVLRFIRECEASSL
jgi:hypothetical protein